MEFHVLSLYPIYETIKAAHGYPKTPPPLPLRKSETYVLFRKTYKELIQDINSDRAVYLWFAVNKQKKVEYVYVGMSDRNKGGLRQRFDDEFRQWYHVYWMTAFKTKQYERQVTQLYPGYDTEIKNQALKHGATHVVYCQNIPNSINIPKLEKELIALFDFPRGNDDEEGFMKPGTYSEEADTIFEEFVRITKTVKPYEI